MAYSHPPSLCLMTIEAIFINLNFKFPRQTGGRGLCACRHSHSAITITIADIMCVIMMCARMERSPSAEGKVWKLNPQIGNKQTARASDEWGELPGHRAEREIGESLGPSNDLIKHTHTQTSWRLKRLLAPFCPSRLGTKPWPLCTLDLFIHYNNDVTLSLSLPFALFLGLTQSIMHFTGCFMLVSPLFGLISFFSLAHLYLHKRKPSNGLASKSFFTEFRKPELRLGFSLLHYATAWILYSFVKRVTLFCCDLGGLVFVVSGQTPLDRCMMNGFFCCGSSPATVIPQTWYTPPDGARVNGCKQR